MAALRAAPGAEDEDDDEDDDDDGEVPLSVLISSLPTCSMLHSCPSVRRHASSATWSTF